MLAELDYPTLPGRKPRSHGNTPEIAARVKANTGLAHLAAMRAWGGGHPRVNYDDVISAAMVALWRCAAAFEPERGFKFTTLAYKPCFRAACQIISVDRGRKKRIRALALESAFDAVGEPSVIEGLIEAEERGARADWLREQLATLPVRDREILKRRYVDEWTLKEIGQSAGLTRERVRQICETLMVQLVVNWRGRGG